MERAGDWRAALSIFKVALRYGWWTKTKEPGSTIRSHRERTQGLTRMEVSAG